MRNLLKATVIVFFAGLFSCQTFDNGGLVKKAEERVQNTWVLESYLRNGVDETNTLMISDLEERYDQEGNYSRSYIDTDQSEFSETGSWDFLEDEKELSISGVSSLPLSDLHSTVSSDYYTVLKLKKDQYWYSYTNGGDTHEFHFVPR